MWTLRLISSPVSRLKLRRILTRQWHYVKSINSSHFLWINSFRDRERRRQSGNKYHENKLKIEQNDYQSCFIGKYSNFEGIVWNEVRLFSILFLQGVHQIRPNKSVVILRFHSNRITRCRAFFKGWFRLLAKIQKFARFVLFLSN